jgi:hypothetical protein
MNRSEQNRDFIEDTPLYRERSSAAPPFPEPGDVLRRGAPEEPRVLPAACLATIATVYRQST